VGLLFSWVALSAAIGGTAGAYVSLALAADLPFVAGFAWIAQVAFAAMIGPLAFLFLIFPTGSPPSQRWAWLGRVMFAAYAVVIVLFAITPGPFEAGFVETQHGVVLNPIALPATWERTIETLTSIAGLIVFGGSMLSIVSLIQRYRRAATTERQQIRWLALLAAVTGVYILVALGLDAASLLPEWASNTTFFVLIILVFVGIPVTCAVAILRHGLWDLDVVVRKTVQYGVLLGGLLAITALALVAAPFLLAGRGGHVPPGTALGFGFGILVALVFVLLRLAARRIASRLIYGRRATPYEVLSTFAGRVGETYSTEDVLPRMAQLLGEATGARVARVWLRIGNVMRADASWPAGAAAPLDVASRGDELPVFGGDRAFEVRHQGELLGALTVSEAPDDPITPKKERLVRDMAAQAGLVLRNVRLIEDLRESRRRIVAAQDARAKKLERDIHDGAQQQLVALAVKLGLAERQVATDPNRATAMLQEAKAETQSALDDLRDLARGIYPPLLADKGLAAALDGQARKSPIPVEIEPVGIGRYAPETEAAVYFSCLEALQNVAKYANASKATVRLAQANGNLTFEVADDGRGFDAAAVGHGSGLQGIADRLAALGGEVTIRSGPGHGTTVAGRLPVEEQSG
jgi:signal transduction histidine kinase